MKNQLSSIKLGILGGGQLARMLALKSHELGMRPYVLNKQVEDSAMQVTPYFVKGDLHSKKDVKTFLRKVDLAVFENEFLDPSMLHEASLETKTSIHPKPKTMALLRDRWLQKSLLKKYKIPTAEFVRVNSVKQMSSLVSLFPNQIVLKKRLFGYDGYGTLITKSKSKTPVEEFIKKHSPNLIAEAFVPFQRELAIILIRNKMGQIIELPLVETHQEEARCLWVKGPCQHKKKDNLVKKLKRMIDEIGYEGVIAFELFETKTELLVNEVAPRVHNSGHYSLDALSEDQFSLHIKAVLNMKLTTPVKRSGGFAMLNLLGNNKTKTSLWPLPPGIKLHWYGKAENRMGRKMGHINQLASTGGKALNQLLKFKKDFL